MRRKKTVTITAEGRDKGKTFLITELPADQAERWAIRALLAISQSGAVITEESLQAGMAGLAGLGVQALGGLSWNLAEPLLDEMFGCIEYQHNIKQGAQPMMSGINSQIEEVATRFALRMAVFQLHLGFSVPDVPPTTDSESEGAENQLSTPTFLSSLGGWFRRAVQLS